MTSQCKISAHLADDKQVVVSISGGHNAPEVLVLKDGETVERSFYDDMVITSKEAEKTGEKPKLSFSQALSHLKQGNKVARSGWNGKGMWLILVPGSENIKPVAGTPYSNAGIVNEVQILPHIDMYTIDSTGRRAMLPGWLASQSDIICEDWEVVE